MAGTIVANTINTDTGIFSTNNAYSGIAKAWVNFNPSSGSSAIIRSSFNVSSVTYVSAGIYTINFTTAFADANYNFVASCAQPAYVSAIALGVGPLNGSYSTYVLAGSLKIIAKRSDTSAGDIDVVCVSVFSS